MKTREQIRQAIDAIMLEATCLREYGNQHPDENVDGDFDDEAEILEGWAAALNWVTEDMPGTSAMFGNVLARISARGDQLMAAYKEAHPTKEKP